MLARSVLCFGDSNTHGQIPGRGPLDRYDRHTRWPGVLQAELGPKWYVIEEGLNGRTTVHDDPIEGAHKNGRTYLRPCIQSHMMLDLVIIMLGTNDLKVRFNKPASEIAMGMGCLIGDIRELASGLGGSAPEIMIVAPPAMLDDIKEWKSIFAGGPEKSRQLALEFEIMADSLGVRFFNAGAVCQCDEADGFHLNADAHRALGVALAREIEAIEWPAVELQR
jgi:lysophospholipase L1-like esterase